MTFKYASKISTLIMSSHTLKVSLVVNFNCFVISLFLHSPGEIFDTGLLVKSSAKKLFDDAIDSGISESSITSEAYKEKEQAGHSRVELIKVKKERESSVESPTKQPEVKKKRKRKVSIECDSFSTPIVKKFKAEPMSSTDDELEPFQGISNARYVDDTQQKTKVKAIKEEVLSQPSTSSQKNQNEFDNKSSDKESSSTKEKKKKKKRKRQDDFETSLQLLLSSRIKSEK